MISCLICQKEFRNLSSHVANKHNISKLEYMIRYPDAKYVTTDLANAFSERSKLMHSKLKSDDPIGYHNTRKETCEKMRGIKGNDFTHSEATKNKMRDSHSGKKRGPHSADTKIKLSQAKIGKPLNLTDDAKILKSNKQKAQWAIRKTDTDSFAKYIDLLSTRRSEYIKQYGITLPKRGRKTNIELRFLNYLEMHDIKYQYQYFLHGKYYDFYLPDFNMLVEVDGEYWHRMPHAIKNDLEKHIIAKDCNIKLLRINEITWVPELIFEKDYEVIKNHNYNIINDRTTKCQNYEISISQI